MDDRTVKRGQTRHSSLVGYKGKKIIESDVSLPKEISDKLKIFTCDQKTLHLVSQLCLAAMKERRARGQESKCLDLSNDLKRNLF